LTAKDAKDSRRSRRRQTAAAGFAKLDQIWHRRGFVRGLSGFSLRSSRSKAFYREGCEGFAKIAKETEGVSRLAVLDQILCAQVRYSLVK
jgi:hypothetical protein